MAPVIPVLAVENVADARPLAEALVAGGLPVLEVTLRTEAALDVISEMAQVPGAVVGAGTVLNPNDIEAVAKRGAKFAVSPGVTPQLLDAMKEDIVAMLPGGATGSEMMTLLDHGYDMQKFFPANVAGGPSAIKSFGGPLPQITFCPTGGVSPSNANDYLSLSNVVCVGGSWITPKDAMTAKDWGKIKELATEAARLG